MPTLRSLVTTVALLAATGFTPLVVAHPGESHEALSAEMTKRNLFMRDQTHLRKRCASQFAARGHEEKATDRRRALVDQLREERGIAVNGKFTSTLMGGMPRSTNCVKMQRTC